MQVSIYVSIGWKSSFNDPGEELAAQRPARNATRGWDWALPHAAVRRENPQPPMLLSFRLKERRGSKAFFWLPSVIGRGCRCEVFQAI